jgi:hypothetical protein
MSIRFSAVRQCRTAFSSCGRISSYSSEAVRSSGVPTTWDNFFRHCTIGGSIPSSDRIENSACSLAPVGRACIVSLTTNPWTHIIVPFWSGNHRLACDVRRTVRQRAHRGVSPDSERVHPSLRFTQQY